MEHQVFHRRKIRFFYQYGQIFSLFPSTSFAEPPRIANSRLLITPRNYFCWQGGKGGFSDLDPNRRTWKHNSWEYSESWDTKGLTKPRATHHLACHLPHAAAHGGSYCCGEEGVWVLTIRAPPTHSGLTWTIVSKLMRLQMVPAFFLRLFLHACESTLVVITSLRCCCFVL